AMGAGADADLAAEALSAAGAPDESGTESAREALGRRWQPPLRGAFAEGAPDLFLQAVDVRAGRMEFLRLEVPPGADLDLEVVRVPRAGAAATAGPAEALLRVPKMG